ncbi:hypothetical protein ANTRET_LOCUS1261 [Anthophora retusa]
MCRLRRNSIQHLASVGVAIMSRELVSRLLLCLLTFFLSIFTQASSYVIPDKCLEYDIYDVEDYLSTLNLDDVPTINMMIGGFKCPVTALPFGALKSDWARLVLLQKAQPKESIFLEKLGRLFRILAMAYFRMKERFDVTEPGFPSTSSVNASSTRRENTAAVSFGKERMNLNGSTIIDSTDIPQSFISSNATSDERSIDTFNVVRTNSTRLNVTGESKEDNFNTMANDISSSIVTVSSVVTVYDSSTKGNVEEKTDVFPGLNTVEQNHTDTSNNYPHNDAVNDGISRTNEPDATETEREINNIVEFFHGNSVISTTNDFIKDQSAVTNNFTVDGLNENKDDSITEGSAEFSTVDNNVSTGLINNIPIIKFPGVSNNISGTVTPTDGYEKSISTSVKDETWRSIFPNKITPATSNNHRNLGKFTGRGDFPLSYDSSYFEDPRVDEIERKEELKLTTVQYHNPEISDVKSNSEESRVYSGKISDNGVASSRESFNQSPSNRRTNDVFQPFERISWNSLNSTLPPNKIKKPSIRKKNPPERDFWKYILITSNDPSITSAATPILIQKPDGTRRSKKRGSLNTSIEKNFRWFYNFGHEDEKYVSKNPNDRQGISIQCKEKRHNEEK